MTGGEDNEASGFASVVVAGFGNDAIGNYSSVSGGEQNTVNSRSDAIVGGDDVLCDIPLNTGACGEVGFSLPD